MLGGFGFGEKWKTGALALSCVVGSLREVKGRIGKLCAFLLLILSLHWRRRRRRRKSGCFWSFVGSKVLHKQVLCSLKFSFLDGQFGPIIEVQVLICPPSLRGFWQYLPLKQIKLK